jgi:hypothetical protein
MQYLLNLQYNNNIIFDDNFFDILIRRDILNNNNYKEFIFIYKGEYCNHLEINLIKLIKLLSVISNKINNFETNLNLVKEYLIEIIREQFKRYPKCFDAFWVDLPVVSFIPSPTFPAIPAIINTEKISIIPGTYIMDTATVIKYGIIPIPGFEYAGKSDKYPDCLFLWDYLYTRDTTNTNNVTKIDYLVTIQCEIPSLPTVGQRLTSKEILKLAISTKTALSPYFPNLQFEIDYANGYYIIKKIINQQQVKTPIKFKTTASPVTTIKIGEFKEYTLTQDEYLKLIKDTTNISIIDNVISPQLIYKKNYQTYTISNNEKGNIILKPEKYTSL